MHALTTKANFHANCNLKMYVSATCSDKKKFGNRTGMATGHLKRWNCPISRARKVFKGERLDNSTKLFV